MMAVSLALRILTITAVSCVLAATGARAEHLELCEKATAAQEAGNYDLAIDYFTRCIGRGGLTAEELAAAYNGRGVTQARKGAFDRAVPDYDEAIRLDPGRADFYNDRGVAHARMGEDDLAVGDFGDAIRRDPGLIRAYFNRGHVRRRMDEDDQAVLDYGEVIRLEPAFAHQLLWLSALPHQHR
jgi:tetratricopeptide (TPR) repeat protein